MSLNANIKESAAGKLVIEFTVTGQTEARFRHLWKTMKDGDGELSAALLKMFEISEEAVNFAGKVNERSDP